MPLARAYRVASGGVANGSTLVAFNTVVIHRVMGETEMRSMIEGGLECADVRCVADRLSTV
ncbi:uncharacterized protein N7484_010026 [Penicillium longicatenatum]|uniref:uncharacterized protein n=1 Tax=Penicillium longicatenatum TaxID=1561947 RepID=UPI002548EDDB|nr:uncharacterized protein N7484_010026 [Penicillium longicatenatum]KAJ5636713.1 hypothetical protein N7484_010026 [Penicillium longicatenatum]